MKDIDLLTVGYHKGEIDFSICGAVSDLSREELASFRNMIIVAIYQAEDMWRRNHQTEAGDCSKESK
jgi:3-oxoacyl-(acyl-carrier-protein) synthase